MIFAATFLGFVAGFTVAALLVRRRPVIDPDCPDCLAEAGLTELANRVAREQDGARRE